MTCSRSPHQNVEIPVLQSTRSWNRNLVRRRTRGASLTSRVAQHPVLEPVGFSLQEKG